MNQENLQGGLNEFFQFHDVDPEVADAFGGLFSGHGVLIEHPAEGFFIQIDAVDLEGLGMFRVELGGNRIRRRLQFTEQPGADGEKVATTEFRDFVLVAEAGTHDFGLVVEVLVVVVR